jgi:hypothetical protein
MICINKYCLGDKSKEGEIGTWGQKRNLYRVLERKSERNRPFQRPGVDNIQIGL